MQTAIVAPTIIMPKTPSKRIPVSFGEIVKRRIITEVIITKDRIKFEKPVLRTPCTYSMSEFILDTTITSYSDR